MNYQNDDLRIKEINELLPPLRSWKNSLLPKMLQTLLHMLAKRSIQILKGDDDRLLVVIGPCSIHDPGSGERVCRPPADPARGAEGRARDRHAGLF